MRTDMIVVNYSGLLDALEFVSGAALTGDGAYISKESGGARSKRNTLERPSKTGARPIR